MFRSLIVTYLAFLLSPLGSFAQEGTTGADTAPRTADPHQQLRREMQKLGDWAEQAEHVQKAVDSVWTRNRWDTEADLFAKEAVSRVAEIPPWDIEGRIDTLTGLLADRYALSETQANELKHKMLSETGRLLFEHSPTLMKRVRGAVATRVSNRPFTPEQIAEWTEEGEALWRDSQETIDRLTGTLEEMADDDHKAILRRDLESWEKRRKYLDERRESWVRGEWRPEDWGLESDPIQRQAPTTRRSDGPQARVRVVPYDETTWESCVRATIQKYRLDPAQTEAALSILREVRERAGAYRHGRGEELEAVPRAERWTHPGYAPVRALFYEMKGRLDRILTNAQRSRDGRNVIVDRV